MANYFRFEPQPAYSTSSDYSQDQIVSDVFDAITSRPDTKLEQTVSLSASGTLTVDLSTFDTVHMVMVQNKSTTYDVDIAYTDLAAHANTHRLSQGGFLAFDTALPSADITFTATSSGAVLLHYVVIGVLTAL